MTSTPRRTVVGTVVLWVTCQAIGGCQMVLGFEDHQLGTLDGGLPQPVTSGGTTGGRGTLQTQATTGGTTAISSKATSGGQATSSSGGHSTTVSGGQTSSATDAGCDVCAVRSALVHRYSFDGSGTQVTDSVGSADGTVVGTQLSGNGTVVLSGSGDYVTLPSGIVSALTNATFEAWITWQGGAPWQRVFDFGSSSSKSGQGVTYLFLTVEADSTSGYPRAIYSTGGVTAETRLSATSALPKNTAVQIALAFDAAGKTFSLIINGAKVASGQITGSLSGLNDVNNWLGHSQFSGDPDFSGTFDEFRIYQAALSASQLNLTYNLGPNATFK